FPPGCTERGQGSASGGTSLRAGRAKPLRAVYFGRAGSAKKYAGSDSPWVWCRRIGISRFDLVGWYTMHSFKTFLALLLFGVVCAQAASAQSRFGAQGAEGEPNR